MFLLGNKFYIIFITLWIFGLYIVFTTFRTTPTNDRVLEDRVEYLQGEVETLRQKLSQLQAGSKIPDEDSKGNANPECQALRNELKTVKRKLASKTGSTTPQQGPSVEYEQLRRKIQTQTRELSYFALDQMNKIADKVPDSDRLNWQKVINRFADQYRVLLAAIRNLTDVDGYQSWREQEHESLSNLMQGRLNALQNPSKACSDVKRLSCNINKGCGYGCEIHHAMHCFHVAYALGRPLILFSDGWRYNPRGGFDEIFHPLSKNCTHADVAGAEAWARYKSADVVEIPLIDNIHPKEDFMPMTVPADLSQRLIRLHGNPFVWFTGQLMKYLLRPQPWLTELLAKKFEAIKFETPIVGIHVRRTDKVGSEAAFHDISEYMKFVEDYYITYQYQNPTLTFKKRVYIATDEPKVFSEARSKYPDYIFYGDTAVAQSAQLNSRYGTESLKGVLLDIHFLSLSDYLVCTFSSQICRVAYEVMQQRVIDGAWRVQPLDDVYYFGGQNAHNQRAVMSHTADWPNEFSFQRGDIIGTEGNHWDGFSKGTDKTSGLSGLYPSYKVEEIVAIAEMYTYPEVQVKPDNNNM